ncbi:MAG: DUF1573 domain-containing protein [candidate division Zixibacteria bacterium]|nr:DUF1573 domain-containing protein [candidate division Zixibacteria bacterium]MDD5426429.1 DUF1573 domain-containing protein [candidate division Zixibacteria bacterium]
MTGLCLGLVGSDTLPQGEKPPNSRLHGSWNFGFLPQKAEVSHLFYVYNDGTKPLTVYRIDPGCSCTGTTKIEQPILPGDSAAIEVTFKSGRYQNRVHKAAKIYTDDPIAPVRQYRIISNVFKEGEKTGDIAITPTRLTWKTELDKSTLTADTLHLSNLGDRERKITVLHYPEELVANVTSETTLAPGAGGSLILEYISGTVSENMKGLSLTLAFTGTDTTIVTVPIEIK